MSRHADILDQQERLRGPLFGSVILHGALFSSLALYALISPSPSRSQFGDPNPKGGGEVVVTPVKAIPLPRRSENTNPVANDTESQVPLPPAEKKVQKLVPTPEPDAIALKGRQLKPSPQQTSRYRPPEPDKPNQLYSDKGRAASSPMLTLEGGGTVGLNPNSVLGARFAWYEQLIRQRIGEKWRTTDLDPRLQTSPVAVVTFDILRDGSIRNVRIDKSSGNYALDASAQRAVTEANPLPHLPDGFERNVANVEFWFQLKR